ncbi:hypothetical protein D3C81_1443250 [compost metagenome]
MMLGSLGLGVYVVPGDTYSTSGSSGFGGSTSNGLAKICKLSCTLPLTSTESFTGPDMVKVIVLPLVSGIMLLCDGRISADSMFPVLSVTDSSAGPFVSK